MNKFNQKHILEKSQRREKKRTDKRSTTAEEVIFIFEKILDDWKTIKIYNTIIQNNSYSKTDKKSVEKISTGNCKVHQSELSNERYIYYLELREKVYTHHNEKKTTCKLATTTHASPNYSQKTCYSSNDLSSHLILSSNSFA
jgi:hypothetical protein